MLVREDHALALRIQTQRAEDPAARHAASGDLELVFVEVEGVATVAFEDMVTAYPVRQLLRGARVLVILPVLRKLDADEVVRAPREQAVTLRLVDDVVRRADQVRQRDRLDALACLIAKSAERYELGHVSILGPRSQ